MRSVYLLLIAFLLTPTFAWSQETTDDRATDSSISNQQSAISNPLTDFVTRGPEEWTSPKGLHSTLQVMLLLTVLSLAPAILLMTTSFVRIIVVLGLLRQALGTQQLPPSQVITSIALFMTLLVMTPVWSEVYNDAIQPYSREEIGLEEAWNGA